MTTQNVKVRFLLAASLLAAQGFAGAAWAAEAAPSMQAANASRWNVMYGVMGGHQRLTLNWESPVLWSHPLGGGHVDLTGEVGVSYWLRHGYEPRRDRDVWQVSATPMLRWWMNERVFVEGGVGLTGFSRTTFANKDMSTALQFGSQVGVGMQLTPSTRVGVRFAHFSNASIKRPNPGLNIVQLVASVRF